VRLIPEEDLREWDPTLQSFTNVNTLEEYDEAVAIFRSVPAPKED